VTDDAFASTNSTTQLANLNGQGISLLVAGSSATVGSVHVGTTKTFIKFQLQSSLPPAAAAANVAKATLKLLRSLRKDSCPCSERSRRVRPDILRRAVQP